MYRASIEVLTDGSELTEPALFLTIRRCNDSNTTKEHINKNDQIDTEVDVNCIYYEQHNSSEKSTDNDIDEGTIIARYNLTGIPSLTSRISTDQSYKLLQGGAFKAIFIPSLISSSSFDNDTIDDDDNNRIYTDNMRGASLGGLPSLFLSLIQSGYKVVQPSTTISNQNISNEDSDSAPEIDDSISQSSSGYGDVSIVGPRGIGSTVDGILDTMFGNVRRRPSIRICEVPNENGIWYEVYVDSYVKIWGQSIRQLSSESVNGSSNKREEVNNEEEPSVSSSSSSDEDSRDEESEEAGGDNNNPSSSTESYSIIYIVMLLPQKTKYGTGEGGSYSFAIIPRDPSQQQQIALQTLRNLPQEIVSSRNDSTLLDFILHLDPPVYNGDSKEASNVNDEPLSKRQRTECATDDETLKRVPLHEIEVPSWVNQITKHHLMTSPNHTSIDEGILIRAQQRSKLLQDSLPFAFLLASNHSSVRQDYNRNQYTTLAYGLRSCISVILNGWNKSDTKQPYSFLSRVESINNRCSKASLISTQEEEAKEHMTARVDYKSTVQSIKCSFYGGSCFCGKCSSANNDADGNEIDLDDSSDSDESQTSKKEDIRIPAHDAIDLSSPYILILGTGCATPSPLRGSSAYGILLPTALDGGVSSLVLGAILECGEGTLTSLLRHIPSIHDISNRYTSMLTSLEVHLSHVSFIWISHAHLDHYGDLPIVVQAIINAKQKCNEINHQEPNKLLVIAPSKVLKYLNVMLNDTTTTRSSIRKTYKHLYAVTHRELQYSPFARHLISLVTGYKLPRQSGQIQQEQKHHYHPFQALQNVEVEHCREAFGLVLTLNVPTKHTLSHNHIHSTDTSRFILCFSGDTRPSIQFAKKCQSYSSPYPINLLLHESTFLHDTQGQAEAARKRHSTTTEALDIANHMNAQCCILTHFSQRYRHISVQDIGSSSSYPFCWGVAIDGMMIPLTKHALSTVNILSKCVDNLILQSDTY